jgi:hypothetical protein
MHCDGAETAYMAETIVIVEVRTIPVTVQQYRE